MPVYWRYLIPGDIIQATDLFLPEGSGEWIVVDEDAGMRYLVGSVFNYGVLVPGFMRPLNKDGSK